MPADPALTSKMASAADAALATIGRNSGEFFDRQVEGDFDLTEFTDADAQNSVNSVLSVASFLLLSPCDQPVTTKTAVELPDDLLIEAKKHTAYGRAAGPELNDSLAF